MHESVLLEQAVDALRVVPGGCYIDGTLGAGGHTQAILERAGDSGCVFAYDKDPAVIEAATVRWQSDARMRLFHASFSRMEQDMESHGRIGRVDGILLDLGVSSMQLDQGERGFSFRHDGPLDMRLDTTQGMTAREWINETEEQEIARVIWQYGEERFSRRIAKAVLRARSRASIQTTHQLSEIVRGVMPYKATKKHPATRTFQAIRIHLNQELVELEAVLPQCAMLLAPGGRLVVISFHSLEDRVVKRFMRPKSLPPRSYYTDLTVQTEELPSMDYVARVVPSKEEVARNPRARSAVMRIAEKSI